MKGPAIFLAQFMADDGPFATLAGAARTMAGFGYHGVQLPSWDGRVMDLTLAAESQDYCDEIKGRCAEAGVAITELATHFQGQLVAVHPCYDTLFDSFAPEAVRGDPPARTRWATDQLVLAARASANMGLSAHATFSGPSFGRWSIHGRSGLPAWWRKASPNLRGDGSRSSTHSTLPASTSVSKSIPVKICMTA